MSATVETVTLREHLAALHEADQRFYAERDRRYTEVAIEQGKALQIKEAGDTAALALARDIQTYKDDRDNRLREQINSERGLYATKSDLQASVDKIEATIRPVIDYVAADRGRSRGTDNVWKMIALGISILLGLITIGTFVFITTRQPQPAIYVPSPTGTLLPSPPAPVTR